MDHVLKYADQIRKKLRVDSIDVLQFHVWDDSWTDNPEFRTTVEKLKDGVDPATRPQSEPLGARERHQSPAHPASRRSSNGSTNIFDQAPEDKLFPLCQVNSTIGVTRRRYHSDEGSLGGKMSSKTRFPKSIGARLLRPGKSRQHNSRLANKRKLCPPA